MHLLTSHHVSNVATMPLCPPPRREPSSGRKTGVAYLQFSSAAEAQAALGLDGEGKGLLVFRAATISVGLRTPAPLGCKACHSLLLCSFAPPATSSAAAMQCVLCCPPPSMCRLGSAAAHHPSGA